MPKIYGKRETGDNAIPSFWPEATKRWFESLGEIPWVSLAAGSTVLGGAILFLYFQSIGYMPTDLSALAGLGSVTALAALAALALFLALVVGLFAPAALYRQHVADEQSELGGSHRPFSALELVFLQLGGLGLVLLLLAYRNHRDCGGLNWPQLGLGAPLALLGLVAFSSIVGAAGRTPQRFWRGYTALAVALLALLPFYLVFDLKEHLAWSKEASTLALWALWLVFVLGNALLATRLSGRGVIVMATFLAACFVVGFSQIADRREVFPTMVATTLGVRSDGPTTLLVTAQTCALVRDALVRTGDEALVSCREGRWSEVEAQILSSVGERWLIELDASSADGHVPPARIRMTIPGSQVQWVGPVRVVGELHTCLR